MVKLQCLRIELALRFDTLEHMVDETLVILYEPRHGKMCLRGKFGLLGILWFLNRPLYDEQTHFCLTKIFKLLEKILEFELWTA